MILLVGNALSLVGGDHVPAAEVASFCETLASILARGRSAVTSVVLGVVGDLMRGGVATLAILEESGLLDSVSSTLQRCLEEENLECACLASTALGDIALAASESFADGEGGPDEALMLASRFAGMMCLSALVSAAVGSDDDEAVGDVFRAVFEGVSSLFMAVGTVDEIRQEQRPAADAFIRDIAAVIKTGMPRAVEFPEACKFVLNATYDGYVGLPECFNFAGTMVAADVSAWLTMASALVADDETAPTMIAGIREKLATA